MIHTIQADFYRLFRSKGFWITEFILFSSWGRSNRQAL